MDKANSLSTHELAQRFWKCSSQYAVLLSQNRRTLSRAAFRRLLAAHRGASEWAVRNELTEVSLPWLERVRQLVDQAFGELERGLPDRELVRRLDHEFCHLATGMTCRESAGSPPRVVSRQSPQ